MMKARFDLAVHLSSHTAPTELDPRTLLPAPMKVFMDSGLARLGKVSRVRGVVGQRRDCIMLSD
jgi:hypothetical protein